MINNNKPINTIPIITPRTIHRIGFSSTRDSRQAMIVKQQKYEYKESLFGAKQWNQSVEAKFHFKKILPE